MAKQEIFFICFSFIAISNAAVSAPTDFKSSEVRSTSFTTTWTMEGDLEYEIAVVAYYGGIPNALAPLGIEKVTSPHKITKINSMEDLMPNTYYNIRLFAINPADGDFVAKDIAKLSTASPAPTNLQITNVDKTQFIVTWDHDRTGEIQETTNYQVSYPSADGSTQTKFTNSLSTSLTIDELKSTNVYTVSCRAIGTPGVVISDKSNSLFATTAGIASPAGLKKTTVRSTSFTIIWDENSNFKYKIVVQNLFETLNPSISNNDVKSPFVVKTTSLGSPLKANTKYNIYLFAVNSMNEYSNPACIKNSTTAAPAPTNVEISNVVSTQFDINWSYTNPTYNPDYLLQIATKYIVTYTPDGKMSKTKNVTEKSLVINGLTSNTDYTVSVVAWKNDKIFTDDSAPSTQATVPRKLNVPTSMHQTTTSISLQWDSVEGTSTSLTYIVTWNPPSDDGTNNTPGITSNSTTIEDLTPGTRYNFTVSAVNNGGSGLPSEPSSLYTDPDTVKNLTLSQNPTNPSTILDLTWIKPHGLGNIILVKYDSLTSSSLTANKPVNFSTTSISIIVIPGNNYTVNVTVISNGLASMTVMEQLNSKPSEPVYTVELSTNKFQLMWNEPDGYVEGFIIQFDNKSIQLDAKSRSHNIGNLTSYTSYTIQMYSWITNIYGNMEQSISTPSTFTTWANPPPLSNPQASLNQDVTSATTTIRFILPADTYNDADAPIEYYAVYVTSGDATGTTPDVTRNETCVISENGTINECVALWTDGQGKPTTFNNTMNEIGSSRSNQRITFIIGDGIDTMSPWNQVFTNYPLQPGTSYRISVAAKTNNPQMTGMDWSSPIQTLGTATTGTDAGLIAGLVGAAVVIVLALVGFYFYKKRYIQKEPPREDSRQATNNLKLLNISMTIHLSQFAERMKTISHQTVFEEFKNLEAVGLKQSTDVARQSQNVAKNRCSEMIPYDESRVQIVVVFGQNSSDYINASYIKGQSSDEEYIATQGPLSNTIDDFWKMIWDQKSKYIIMLGGLVIKGKVACNQYWPCNDKPLRNKHMIVRLISQTNSKDWTRREIQVESNGEMRQITQFHFTGWDEDEFSKDSMRSLVGFVSRVRSEINETTNSGPAVVHCINGCGRTGTFVAIDRLLQQMEEKSSVNISDTVRQLRENRIYMVENYHQYLMLYKAVESVLGDMYEEVQPNRNYINVGPGRNETDHVIYQTIPEVCKQYEPYVIPPVPSEEGSKDMIQESES